MRYQREGIAYQQELIPCNGMKHLVEAHAEKVASLLKHEIGSDVSAAVSAAGGRIHTADFSDLDANHGSIYVHGEADFDVVVAFFTSPRRDQFTIAHELGHYVLHADAGKKPIIANRKGTGRVEWEANWFAAAFLMPQKEFTKAWAELGDVDAVAVRFNVSSEAAEVRAKRLGLAND